jgi:hypothetical protein
MVFHGSETRQGLLLSDAYLVPELGHRGAGDVDGCAYHADAGDEVGITLAVGVVDFGAPESASGITPLGDCFDTGLLGVTHGSFSLVGFGFQDGEDSLVQGLLDFVEFGFVAKGAQCTEHSADFFVGECHGSFSV